MKKDAVRVTATIPVAPTTLYFAWLNSDQHSAMTGGKAKIEPDVGTKFTAGDGYISGKLMTLDLGRRIIMSWRTTEFPRDAADSRVELHLEALGENTRVTILHTEIPEGQGERYRAGWAEHYFDPMRRYFSKYLPDPRKPPPPRPPPPPMDEEAEEEETPSRKAKGGLAAGGSTVAKTEAKAAPPAKAARAAPRPAAKNASVEPTPAPALKPVSKPAAKAAKKPPARPAKKPAKKPAAKPAKKPAQKRAKPAKKKKR